MKNKSYDIGKTDIKPFGTVEPIIKPFGTKKPFPDSSNNSDCHRKTSSPMTPSLEVREGHAQVKGGSKNGSENE